MYNEKYLYHATDIRNVESILKNGIFVGFDNCVYLAETQEDALKFMQFRWDIPEFAVFQLETKKMTRRRIVESFDHNPQFFQCRAWLYTKDITPKAILSHATFKRVREGDE